MNNINDIDLTIKATDNQLKINNATINSSTDKAINDLTQIDNSIINHTTNKSIDNQTDNSIDNQTDNSIINDSTIDNHINNSTINLSNQINTSTIDYSVFKNENKLNDEKFDLLFNDLINKAQINSSKINSSKLNNENSNFSANNSDFSSLYSLESIDSPSLKKIKTNIEMINSEDNDTISFTLSSLSSIENSSPKNNIKSVEQSNESKSFNNQKIDDEFVGGIEEFNQLKSMLKDITVRGKNGGNKSKKKKCKRSINELYIRRSRRLIENELIRSNNNNLGSSFFVSPNDDPYLNNCFDYPINDYNLNNNEQINTNNRQINTNVALLRSDCKLLDFETIDKLKKEDKTTHLINWFNEQNKFFTDNCIRKDENKLNHTILHLDVRWFTDLEEISLSNNKNINYDLVKENLVQRCQMYINALSDCRRLTIRSKYVKKVNNYINQIKICYHLKLSILLDWLKDLRRMTDGSTRDDKFVELILNKIRNNENKKIIFSDLLKQIKFVLVQHDNHIKRLEKRNLIRLKLIREKITSLLINLNNEQFNKY